MMGNRTAMKRLGSLYIITVHSDLQLEGGSEWNLTSVMMSSSTFWRRGVTTSEVRRRCLHHNRTRVPMFDLCLHTAEAQEQA
jgi:hypothetical protein